MGEFYEDVTKIKFLGLNILQKSWHAIENQVHRAPTLTPIPTLTELRPQSFHYNP